jgi:hypothetical protein
MRWCNPVETEGGQYKISASASKVSSINNNMTLKYDEQLFITENNFCVFYYSLLHYCYIKFSTIKPENIIEANYLITTKKLAVEFYLKFGG